MNIKASLFGIFFLFATAGVYAQSDANFQNVTPSTPEVKAMAKYVDIPMSYCTGTPQISIPIGSVKSGSIEIPVSLSYNASGIRVDEEATWVGLGWNLSTGPTLSRAVRGLPDDESTFGYINTISTKKVKYIHSLMDDYTANGAELLQLENIDYNDGTLDVEPDIFSFSALGYSGKFYWSQDSGKFILSPCQNIQITAGTTGITSFTLTLPNGVQCVFGDGVPLETMQSITTSSYVNNVSIADVANNNSYVTSWPIARIVDPRGHEIHYHYTSQTVHQFGRGSETAIPTDDGNGHSTTNTKQSFFRQVYVKPVLQYISADNGYIYFNRSPAVRQDVVDSSQSLDTITVKNILGTEVNSFLFNYYYTSSNDSISLLGIFQYGGIAAKRLMLNSVTQTNLTTGLSLPPYVFTYSNRPLPNRLSSSQDYWGYYNGKNSAQLFLMPRFPVLTTFPFPIPGELPRGFDDPLKADRRIDTAFNKAGTLVKIQYPTGGTTSYFYESNNTPISYFRASDGLERPDAIYPSFSFEGLMPVSPPYPLYYVNTFRITNPVTQVKVTPNVPSPCSILPNASCVFTFYIKSLPDSSIQYMFNTTAAFYIQLPAGLYEIEAVVNQSSLTPVPNFIIQLQWGAVADTNNFLIGGLRVRKIVSSDSVNGTISRSFTYTSDSALRFSSGVLAGYPTHVVKEYDPSNVYLRPYYVSSSAVPLTTDGQTVHYTAVTEYYDTAHASFKTEYRYLADFSSAPALGLQDGAPPMTLDWLNGSLIKKTTYEQLPDSTYRPLSEEENAYIDNGAVDLYGFATQYFRPYNIATAWHMLASTVTTMYSYPNNQQKSLSATTQNYYNGNFLLSGTQTTSSKGQAINSKTWYPADYNDVSGYNIAALNSAHIMNIPIKQEISINGKIRSGSIIKYNANGFPASIYNYENAALADTVLHDPNTMLETNYVLKTNLAFDVNGNIKQVSSLTSYPVNYLWSYNYTLPIAECKNADSASIAYTSFEEVGGNWSYSGNVTGHAVTGSNCYDLSLGNITAVNTNISADLAYIVSYWSTVGAHSVNNTTTLITGKSVTVNGQTWTYYEHQISGGATGITVSGSGLIDELRLYPQNAQMTTYTYSPVIGVTSQCDVNNRITYYEYDGLGRLKLVRDQDGNIIKTIDYHYKNQ